MYAVPFDMLTEEYSFQETIVKTDPIPHSFFCSTASILFDPEC